MRVFTTVPQGNLAVLVIAAALLFPARLRADETSDKSLAHCAAIEGAIARLQCFDDLAHARGLAGPGPTPATPGSVNKWSIAEEKNPLDDSEVVQLQLESDSGRSRFGDKPVLVIRCQHNRPYLAIWWHAYIGIERSEVITRLDKGKAVTLSWFVSNTGEVTMLQKPLLSNFVKNMLAASEMVAEVVPYSDPRITATFDITGLQEAIKQHASVCQFT